jgi:hypothetical protein
VAVAALGVDAGRKGGELVFRYGAGRLPDAADTPSSGAVVGPATEKDE